MVKHLTRLGLSSLYEYIAWCTERGFDQSPEKTVYALHEEVDAHHRERERSHARHRVHRNPRKFLQQACAGTMNADDIDRPGWSDICRAIEATANDKAYRDSLREFLLSMEKKAGFVLETVPWGDRSLFYINGLIMSDPGASYIETLEIKKRNLSRDFVVQFRASRYMMCLYWTSV